MGCLSVRSWMVACDLRIPFKTWLIWSWSIHQPQYERSGLLRGTPVWSSKRDPVEQGMWQKAVDFLRMLELLVA